MAPSKKDIFEITLKKDIFEIIFSEKTFSKLLPEKRYFKNMFKIAPSKIIFFKNWFLFKFLSQRRHFQKTLTS